MCNAQALSYAFISHTLLLVVQKDSWTFQSNMHWRTYLQLTAALMHQACLLSLLMVE